MRKGELKKKAILETAESLFLEKGYQETAIDEILSRLSTSKGSLYHHFESKQQILEEICREKMLASAEEYHLQIPDGPLAALDRLLYCAQPLRNGKEALLLMLLPILNTPDGDTTLCSMQRVQKQIFYPELEKILFQLRSDRSAFWTPEYLPVLAWDLFLAGQQTLLSVSRALCGKTTDAPTLALSIDAMRFAWERLLDLPYGSMTIVRAEEALSCVYHTAQHFKYLS